MIALFMREISNDIAFLLKFCSYGDEKSYRSLFNVLFPRLKRFAYEFLHSYQLAEEVASDIMYTVWEKRDELPEIKNISVYLMVAAKNKCLNILKQPKLNNTVSLHGEEVDGLLKDLNPEQILMRTEMENRIASAINLLPDRCKLVFKMVREEK